MGLSCGGSERPVLTVWHRKVSLGSGYVLNPAIRRSQSSLGPLTVCSDLGLLCVALCVWGGGGDLLRSCRGRYRPLEVVRDALGMPKVF